MNKFESISIQKNLRESYNSFFPTKGTLVLGVSGGADSMALLYLFHKNKIPVFVVHVNYGQRGADSEADKKLVEDVCTMWGIECCAVSLEPYTNSGNFQDWARKQRYQIFRDVRREINGVGICIAHHADDQLETILFKMLRGAGISSWRALEEWDGEIYRPLLHLPKSKIQAFCTIEAIPFRVDSSNESNKYTRNALRNLVFPVFDKCIPGWKSNLSSISDKAAVAHEILELMLDSMVKHASLDIQMLSEYSQNLKASILNKFLDTYTGYKPSKGEILNIVTLLSSQTGNEIRLHGGIRLIIDRGKLVIKTKTNRPHVEKIISATELMHSVMFDDWEFICQTTPSNTVLNISMDNIVWPLKLRQWENGDKFQPFGMDGRQKVSDHLTNRKINASKREETLILIDAGGTICAVLYPQASINGEHGCISELVKISKSTQQVLSISKREL